MNVVELMEELKKYNPNAEVTTPYSETISVGYVASVEDETFTPENTPFVFIEWSEYEEDD